jgi:hypothetical protein
MTRTVKLFVVADVHGFYDELIAALKEKGWFDYTGKKKLVLCGDAMDRGPKAWKLEAFLMELLANDELIFVRGNHEDLMLWMFDDIKNDMESFRDQRSDHIHNKTLDTALQLSMMTLDEFFAKPKELINRTKKTDFVKTLIPASVNYFETKNYIFVHGWIPCKVERVYGIKSYTYMPNWRKASEQDWIGARWINGMYAAYMHDVLEYGKTIVCGHWHASYGHSRLKHICSEHGPDAIYDPYYDNGIIAIDTCTARTKRINCLVIDDELLED